MESTQAVPQDTYRAPRDEGEYDRLRLQHDMVKDVMGGKLLLSPVDLSAPNLQVLDSGTAKAHWVIDLARSLSSESRVVGTDIAPQHFPPESQRPGNVTLTTHSIFENWPSDYIKAFDVVHQRFVLAACPDEQVAAESVARLYACVKPGGWIELHEGNMLTIREGPEHAAFMRFRDMMVKSWALIKQQPAPGLQIGKWLREAGATDIQETTQVIKVGAEAENKAEGERAMAVLFQMLDGMKAMLGGRLRSYPH